MSFVLLPREKPSPEEVGLKAHRQIAMLAAGLPVPDFFCLSRKAFEAWLQPVRDELRERLERLDFGDGRKLELGSREIRGWLLERPVPPGIALELESACARVFSPDDLVAVRGCFTSEKGPCEDGADQPFAGASESHLFQEARGVASCVLGCWASVVSVPALLYRRSANIDLLAHSVAVMVQRMVPAEKSFVVFTRDPTTGAHELVVAAVPGMGEGVVQERAEADHFFLSPEGEVLRSTVSREREPVFGTEELREIAALARRVEGLFSAPQDIEGCFASGGAFLVQSRPIALPREDRVVWDNSNVTESFPGVTRPLTYSFARSFYEEVFRDCFLGLGVPEARVEALAPELERMIGYLDGRVYYRLTTFYELFSAHPLFCIYREHWEKMIGLDRPLDQAGETHGVLSRARAVANLAFGFVRHEARMESFYERFARDLARVQKLRTSEATADELVREARGFSRDCFRYWGITLVNDAFLILAFGLLERVFRAWGLLEGSPSLVNDLLTGERDLVSAQVVESAVALGEELQRDPALMSCFERHGLERVLGELERSREHPGFLARVAEHMDRYGARGPEDLKLEAKAMRETPGALMALVLRYAKDGVRTSTLRRRELAVRERAEATLRAKLAGRPLRRAAISKLLSIVRLCTRHRERSRYCRSELFAASRSMFRETGEKLARSGVLEHADDVFDLTLDELTGAVQGTSVVSDFRALVLLRRKERERAEGTRLGAQVITHGAVAARRREGPQPAPEQGELRGLGSSAGIVRGRARVVLKPDAPLDRETAPILVARETDPGWLYLMLASSGLVVERGSLLSHTAIAGRKFGIPTVVGVSGATTRIRDGELLEIDGSLGSVRRLASP